MRHICLILLMLASLCPAMASITLSGIVVNASNRERVHGAEVRAVGTTISVLTNEDGHFVLKLPECPKAIKVIAVGFKNKEIPCASLDNLTDIVVTLQPQSHLLEAVTVYSADNIVKSAISKIPRNYCSKSECLSCFYRETVQKRNHFTSLSEAVMDMYKTDYGKGIGADKIQIVKGRSLISQRQKDTLSIKVMGGPHEAVTIDLVKNREVLFYEGDLDAYQYVMEDGTTINDRAHYVVRIRPIALREYPLYNGLLYIDAETLAFTRIELSLDVSNREKATRFMLVKKPRGLRFRPRALNTTVTYHYDGQCSRISYVRNEYVFNCDWRRRLFATSYKAVSEMVVTDHHESEIPRGRKNMFGRHDTLSPNVADFTDADFWRDYNIIEPSVSLETAVGRLRKRAEK